jgi:hypothetical protein
VVTERARDDGGNGVKGKASLLYIVHSTFICYGPRLANIGKV